MFLIGFRFCNRGEVPLGIEFCLFKIEGSDKYRFALDLAGEVELIAM